MKSICTPLFLGLVIAAGLSSAQPVITSVVDPYTGGTKLTPGGQAVITGTNLGLSPQVTVGGLNAFTLAPPLFGTQITIEIPVAATAGASVPLIVTTAAGASPAFTIALVPYAPVLIGLTSGALTSPRHQSNGVGVTPLTPAAPGETIVFYAIGLGPTNPVVNTGALGPPSPFALTTTTPTVTLGTNSPVNAPARLANGQAFFGANGPNGLAGSNQAFIGVFQVATTVPAGTAVGTYPLTLSIGGVTSNTLTVAVGPAPTGPVISAIVGESGKTVLCPGDIAILSGLNLGANPTVTVAGKTAYNVAANNGNQMTIQIPVDAPLGAAAVTLATGGQTSAAFSITLTQFAPAMIPNGGGGVNQPVHQSNNSPVTAANPATPGEPLYIVAYGLGPTNPAVATGTPAPDTSAATTTVPVVNLGGSQAIGVTAVLAGGQVGLYVVQFVVPPNFTSANYITWITIGGVSTGTTITQVFTGPVVTNVMNAASSIPAGLPNAGIAQGAIFTLVGVNLGPATLSIAKNAFQSTTLSGTSISVTVAGTTVAPLMYYTSATQVAALLPSNTPVGTGTVTVTNNGQIGVAAQITVVQSNLGIFTVTSDGQGVGIVTYPDYSLVSSMKAANCGGVYTTCGAANPGDVLTVWATGLGPVSGSDASGTGLGVDMTSIDLKLWLGGVSAQVLFRGRGCCIGEDQIAFVVPDNVPTGCAVPMAIQIGNQISNYTVIAVAPKGSRTCIPSSPIFPANTVPLLTTGTTPITFAEFDLERFPSQNAQGIVSTTASTDTASLDLLSFTVPSAIQPFIVSYLDDLPLGTCRVYNSLRRPDGGDQLAGLKQLDGGPTFKITGPNGIQNIPPDGKTVTLAPGTFFSPGAYTITGTGGADVGSVSAPFTIPAPATLTSPASGPNVIVNRTNGVTLTWTGGAGNSVIRIDGGDATDNSGSNGATFSCFAPATAGTFTIPASVLLAIPPGTFSNSVWDFISFSYSTFNASGLNLGNIQMRYATPIFTTIQ